MSELKYLIKTITQKTGIEFAVRNASHEDLVRIPEGKAIVNTETGKTFFRFSFRGSEYIASINGADKTTANYAYLISGLLENTGNSDLSLGLNDYLKKIVIGDCTRLQVQKFHVKFNVPDIPVYTLVITAEKGSSGEIMNVLDSYASNSLDTPIHMEDGSFGYVKFLEGQDAEYQSPTEFAEYLCQSLLEELGISVQIGVGTVARHLTEVSNSYQQALVALKLSAMFNSKGAVHSYREYALVKILEDIPKAKLKEYLDILTNEDSASVFEDEDMLNTAEEFLENSLNVSETSRNLFMHRNTLMYRLEKIEKATGLNIKSFSDAVTFRVITILYKILK